MPDSEEISLQNILRTQTVHNLMYNAICWINVQYIIVSIWQLLTSTISRPTAVIHCRRHCKCNTLPQLSPSGGQTGLGQSHKDGLMKIGTDLYEDYCCCSEAKSTLLLRILQCIKMYIKEKHGKPNFSVKHIYKMWPFWCYLWCIMQKIKLKIDFKILTVVAFSKLLCTRQWGNHKRNSSTLRASSSLQDWGGSVCWRIPS